MTSQNNTSGIHPKGNKLLIRPVEVEKVSKGGIYIPASIQEKEDMGQMFGTVVEIGGMCWVQEDEPRCAVGDYIIFARYAGQVFPGNDGVTYRLINALDVIATKDQSPEDALLNGNSRREVDLKVNTTDIEKEVSHA